MARRKSVPPKPAEMLVPEVELDGPVPGAQGHRVKVGRMMSVPAFRHETWGMVSRRTGVVRRIYRRGDDPRILVDLGQYVVEASQCRRSSAKGAE